MNKTFSKEEFQEMVAKLEAEFQSIMKSEQAESAQRLAKSEDEAKEEPKEEKKEDESKEEEAKEEPKAEESKEEPKAEESKEEEQKEDESHGYDEEDLEELHKMYSSMSKAERKAHQEAIEKCGEITQMAKSEEAQPEVKTEETAQSNEEVGLLKSEVEAIKKENEDLKKNIEGLVAAMNAYVTKKAPARKAITNIEFVKKSEEENQPKPLSKKEVDAILAQKVTDPSLSRADREAINSFYLTNAGVEKIAHLLKQ